MKNAIMQVENSLRTRLTPGPVGFPLDEVIEYLGCVNYATSDRVLNQIKTRMKRSPGAPLTMVVTSAGGPSGTGMGFYDTVRSVLRPTLTTVGAGDIDSSGLIIFLTGSRRYVTPHTSALLHSAGRYFEAHTRYVARQLLTMAEEDALKDEQYASIVAANSHGRLSVEKVLDLMKEEVLLTPADLMRYGLADGIIDTLSLRVMGT